MRLFFYYALHSFKNQLKKLFKSWFLIFFLVCFLVGGGIGAGIAALEDAAEPSEETAAELEEALPEDDESAEEDASKPSAVELLGLTTTGVIEFFAGLVILIVYVAGSFVGYTYTYQRRRKLLNRYQKSLRSLEKIYRQEDQERKEQA